MVTVVNTPRTNDSNNSSALLLAIVVLILVGILFWYFARPFLRGGVQTPQTINEGDTIQNTVEEGTTQAPQVPDEVNLQVPDQIDVNVDTPAASGQ